MKLTAPSIARFAATLVVLAVPALSHAQTDQHMPTAVEMIALPAYCQAKFGATSKEVHDQWRLRMGPDRFIHLHHYCHGLNYMRRASGAVDGQKRQLYLQRASGEFGYVIRNWPPEFELAVQAKQQKSVADAMLGTR